MTERMTLRRHHLRHIPELTVSDELLRARFLPGCSTANCPAVCCRNGVWVDVVERDRILEHADLVRRHMDPQQERDPVKWFTDEPRPDSDFPSGQCVGTLVSGSACVFLDGDNRCVLQKADEAEANGAIGLKPFFCAAFPISINEGVLILTSGELKRCQACCRPDPDGTLSVFEVCRAELKYVLGEAGTRELRETARRTR